MRLFVALEPSPECRHALQRLQARLERMLPPTVRYTLPAQLHLTLKFLGEIPAPQLPEVNALLRGAFSKGVQPTLALKSLGCFPEHGPIRILWAGVAVTPESALKDLVARLESPSLVEEARAFHAHITLGRVRGTLPNQARAPLSKIAVEPVSWKVPEGVLFESSLTSQGSKYTMRERFPFKAENDHVLQV